MGETKLDIAVQVAKVGSAIPSERAGVNYQVSLGSPALLPRSRTYARGPRHTGSHLAVMTPVSQVVQNRIGYLSGCSAYWSEAQESATSLEANTECRRRSESTYFAVSANTMQAEEVHIGCVGWSDKVLTTLLVIAKSPISILTSLQSTDRRLRPSG